MLSFLDRSRTVAGPGFNRWLVTKAALAIHLIKWFPGRPGMATGLAIMGFGVLWVVVLTPLAWGVYNTVKTSANPFTSSAPDAQAATPPGATR